MTTPPESQRWQLVPELLPCPFCGGEAKLHPATRGYKASVECTVCETGNPCFVDIDYPHDSAREAAEEWNRRAVPVMPKLPQMPNKKGCVCEIDGKTRTFDERDLRKYGERCMKAAAPKAPAMPDEAIDELLDTLDTLARDYDVYEFGLPLGVECQPQFREAVRAWLAATGRTKE